MKKENRPILYEEPRALIDGLQLQLIQAPERTRFDEVMRAEHYLKSAELVGERLRYVATYQGQWVALLSWSAAAYHLQHREQWIGWSVRQKKRRLPLVVNNSRFLIRVAVHAVPWR